MRVIFKQKTHDYTKKAGELSLAWYAGGSVCIVRRKVERALQKQNLSIILINSITKALWETLHPAFKRDLARYALRYKIEYPVLRKRGVSAYAVFLILIHTLIKRFSLKYENQVQCTKILARLLECMTVKKAILIRLLKKVRYCYRLNQPNTIQIPVTEFSENRDKKYQMLWTNIKKTGRSHSPPVSVIGFIDIVYYLTTGL